MFKTVKSRLVSVSLHHSLNHVGKVEVWLYITVHRPALVFTCGSSHRPLLHLEFIHTHAHWQKQWRVYEKFGNKKVWFTLPTLSYPFFNTFSERKVESGLFLPDTCTNHIKERSKWRRGHGSEGPRQSPKTSRSEESIIVSLKTCTCLLYRQEQHRTLLSFSQYSHHSRTDYFRGLRRQIRMLCVCFNYMDK